MVDSDKRAAPLLPAATSSPTTSVTPVSSAPAAPPAGGGLRRIIIIAAAGLIGVLILLFVIALLLAIFTNVEQSGAVIRLIRDVVIIFLALEGVLIVLSLAILVLQVAKLVNLLQTEIKPILENTQQTIKTAQTTVEFVSANVTHPFVRLTGFVSGVSVLLTNVFGIRKVIKRTVDDVTDKPEGLR